MRIEDKHDWVTRIRATRMTGMEVLSALVKIHNTRDKILIQKFLDEPEKYGDPLLFDLESKLPPLSDEESEKAFQEVEDVMTEARRDKCQQD